MRTGHRTARTVVLRLRFEDYTKATRSRSMPQATSSGADIATTALLLLDAAGPLIRSRGITLVGIALTGLESDEFYQMVLPLDGPDHSGLDVALDGVSARFGTSAAAARQPAAHRRGLRHAAAPRLIARRNRRARAAVMS